MIRLFIFYLLGYNTKKYLFTNFVVNNLRSPENFTEALRLPPQAGGHCPMEHSTQRVRTQCPTSQQIALDYPPDAPPGQFNGKAETHRSGAKPLRNTVYVDKIAY